MTAVRDRQVTRACLSRIATLLLLGLLGACSRSVGLKITAVVPPPLIERHPVTIGVYYRDDFRNHVFVENSEDRPNWQIETGSSQVALFNQLLSAAFEQVLPMQHVYDGRTIVKGVIAPKIEEMQFATPRETLQDFYEAWLKYTIDLYDDQGALLTSWQTTAYGRSPDTLMSTDQVGIDAALKVALRDAGAKFSIGFFRDPGVRQWLTKQ
ncbi:MAG: hypothetical protein IT494_09415 [Gammaproteobacteria bacterium]|nr:hypothetical protein [Gammaproteobacteria bacterium]